MRCACGTAKAGGATSLRNKPTVAIANRALHHACERVHYNVLRIVLVTSLRISCMR